MNVPQSELASLFWAQLWQVTLLIVAAGVLARVGCRRRPHLAYVLWVLVIIKCLTPPVWSSPTGVFSWARIRAPEVSAVAVGEGSGEYPHQPIAVAEPSLWSPPVERAPVAPSADLPIPAADVSTRTISGVLVMLGVWLLGVIVLAGVAVVRWLRCRKLLRTSTVPTPPLVESLTKELSERLGLRRKVRVLVTSSPIGPATYGVVCPTVVLSEAVLDPGRAEQLEPILAHELLHVRRGDVVFAWLQLAAQLVWWFHPLVWWANRQGCREVERCCDEEVVAGLACRPARYARCLLDVLESPEGPRPVYAFPGIHPAGITRRRLQNLMNRNGRFRRRMPRVYWALLAAGLMLVVPGAELVLEGAPAAIEGAGAESGESAAAGEQPPASPAQEKPDLIKVDSVEEGVAKEPGDYVLKFAVEVPKGERFRLEFWQRPAGYCAGFAGLFENERDVPAQFTLTFRYRTDDQGEKKGNVLLSGREMVDFEVDAEGCHPSGLSTIVGAPLGDVPSSEKKLVLAKSSTDWGAVGPSGRRLLFIVRKSESGKSVESITPRGELVVSREPAKTETGPKDPAVELNRRWEVQRREIGTAHVRFRRFRPGGSRLLRLTHEQLAGLFSSLRLEPWEADWRRIAPKLLRDKSLAETPWSEFVFRHVGLKMREDWHREGDLVRTRVFDGELDLYYDTGNRQVNAHLPGASKLGATALHDLRLILRFTRPDELEAETRPDGLVLVRRSGTEIVADPSTGFVHRTTSRDRNGDVSRERRQWQPVEYPGNIVFPKLSAEASYRDGNLSSLELVLIESASFNESFPADAFTLSVPAGTTVVDSRKDTFRPRVFRLKEPVDDLSAYLTRNDAPADRSNR